MKKTRKFNYTITDKGVEIIESLHWAKQERKWDTQIVLITFEEFVKIKNFLTNTHKI
jgi:hypothetical protein